MQLLTPQKMSHTTHTILLIPPPSSGNDQSYSSFSSFSYEVDWKYEEREPETDVNSSDNPLVEDRDEKPMTPPKINPGEPTAVKRGFVKLRLDIAVRVIYTNKY